MKKLMIMLVVSTFILIIALSLLCLNYLQFRSEKSLTKEINYDLLQEGDVIFRKGKSIESYAVYLLDPARNFSHAGIIVYQGGNPCVVHVVPGGNSSPGDSVRLESVNAFISGDKASSFAVYRPRLSEEDRHCAAETALQFYHAGICFDHSYDMATEERLYCTELVYKAFRTATIRPDSLNLSTVNLGMISRVILLPGDLLKNLSFQMIINNSFTN